MDKIENQQQCTDHDANKIPKSKEDYQDKIHCSRPKKGEKTPNNSLGQEQMEKIKHFQ